MKSITQRTISKRERQVLLLISKGEKSIAIAEQLGISKYTVDNHRKNILRKTDSRNTLEMVQWGMKNGLLNGF